MKKKFIVVVVTIFVVLAAAIYALKVYAPAFHFEALEAANVIMAFVPPEIKGIGAKK